MSNQGDPLQSSVVDFSTRYLGRELSDEERERLGALTAQWTRVPREAAMHADATLRESREAMNETLEKASEIARSQVRLAGAGAEGDAHALVRLLEKASSLADLRPSRLPDGRGGGKSHLVIAQIADRLANLVKKEVDVRFQERFGPLAQQVEHALAGLAAAKGGGDPGGAGSGSEAIGNASSTAQAKPASTSGNSP